jgi:hypothetical protein
MSKKVDDDSVQYFKPDISCQLHYWGYNSKTHPVSANNQLQFHKTKLLKTHPTLPWILSLDEEEKVLSLWNYENQHQDWSRSIYSLIHDSDSSASSDSRKSITGAVLAPSAKPKSQFNRRSVDAMNDDLLFRPQSINFSVQKPTDQGVKHKETFGNVKEIDFVDNAVLTYHGTAEGNSVHPASKEHKIYILFDYAIVIVSLMSKKVSCVLTSQSLNKASPVAVDFLSPTLCLIGCNDGNIRIWNTISGKIDKTFLVTKSELYIMKVIPFES